MSIFTDIQEAEAIMAFVQSVESDPTVQADLQEVMPHLKSLGALLPQVASEVKNVVSKASPALLSLYNEFKAKL